MTMKTEQLTIWNVPYDFTFSDNRKMVELNSEHWAKILRVPLKHGNKHEGFWAGKQFINVQVFNDNSIEFTSRNSITIEMLETWFRDNIHAFDSIGYEVLVKEHK